VDTTSRDGQALNFSRAEIETFNLESTDPFEHQRVRNERLEYLEQLNRSPSENPPVTLTYKNLHPSDRSAFDDLYLHMKKTLTKYGHLPRAEDFLEHFQGKSGSGIKGLFDNTEVDKNLVISQILFTRPEDELFEDGYYRVCQIMLTHFYNLESEIIEIIYKDVFPVLGKFEQLLYLSLINPIHEIIHINDLKNLRKLFLHNHNEFIWGTSKSWRNYHLFTQPKILDKSIFLSNIRELSISYVPIYEFPNLASDQISNLVEISFKHLTFSRGIDNLAKFAHKFPKLFRLHLYGTEGIKTIPHGLSKLSNLYNLVILDNTLEYISPDLALAPNLIFLSIRSDKLAVYDPFIINLIDVLLESKKLIVRIIFEVGRKVDLSSGNPESKKIKQQLEELFRKQNELNRYYSKISDSEWIKINKRAYDLMIECSRQLSMFDHKVYTYYKSIGKFGFVDLLLQTRDRPEEYVPATENWEAFTICSGPISIKPNLDLILYPINDNPEDPRYI
jgi:hypothetical protein